MKNHENMKKTIDKYFNKNGNYKKILQNMEKGKSKKIIWKYSLIPICLIVIIGSFVFVDFNDKKKDLNPEESFIDKENNRKLNINVLDKTGAARFDAKITDISTSDFFIPWPEILKDGIEIPEDLDKDNAYTIYTRKDKNSEYDIFNCYVYHYFNESNTRNIRLAFSNTNKPIRDYLFSDEGSKDTIINNIKLKIYRYENIYFAEFKYKGYNFDIETNNIEEQELEDLLSSIIK